MQINSVKDFLAYVQAELKANRLKLPTLPDIAIKVRDAVADSNVTANKIAQIISTDPALSARLIQVANSPLYRGTSEISNIQSAIIRLGNGTIRNLVTSLMTQQMFEAQSPLLKDYFHHIWEQSVNVSAICRVLSNNVSYLDQEEAMLAGLIHQIGKLPILALIDKMPEFKDSPSRIDKLLEVAHPHVGKLIMDSWHFPAELKKATYEYVNFQRDSGPQADYVDVVQVAFLQSIIGTDHPATRIDWQTVPAFAKLGLETDVEVLEIEGLSEEMEITRATFF